MELRQIYTGNLKVTKILILLYFFYKLFSLGVILYCMVLGRYPYKANNDDDLIYMIKTEPLRL